MSKESEATGLFILGEVRDKYALGRRFMESPERFANEFGLDPNGLQCPEVAHTAFKKGKAFEQEVTSASIAPNKESMSRLDSIAAKHFGREYDVSLIPFGLRFREKIAQMGGEITGTGTGTVTFLDGDADVDG